LRIKPLAALGCSVIDIKAIICVRIGYRSARVGTANLFVGDLVFQLYKSAIGNIFEEEDWGPLEYAIMAKHFERQGKTPYMYHSVSVSCFMIAVSGC
jgi:hypothetical protein